MRCNCISTWKKKWETLVGFTIDGATVWQFVNCFVVPSIEQRCSNVGKNMKRYNIFSRESPPTANSGQQPFYFVVCWNGGSCEGHILACTVFFHLPTVCWFFSLPNSHKYLYSKWRNTQDSRGSWAIYRTLFGPDCACKMGFLDGASPKWKWPVAPSILLPGAFELRHLLSPRCTVECNPNPCNVGQ